MQLPKYRCQVQSEMPREAHVGLVDLTGDGSLLGWQKTGNRLQIRAPKSQCVQKVSEHPWLPVETQVSTINEDWRASQNTQEVLTFQ